MHIINFVILLATSIQMNGTKNINIIRGFISDNIRKMWERTNHTMV